jgi:uncharacterized protein
LLTADLVRVRRRGQELRIVPLDPATRARAEQLAEAFLGVALSHVGCTREEFEEACEAISSAGDRKLADGLCKLVEDRCEFEAAAPIEPEELRREVFSAASAAWRAGGFDRHAVLAQAAAARGLGVDELERGLYADLRGAHLLHRVEALSAPGLVAAYELAQAQAVLLRAVRVVVEVECAAPGSYRALFRKLKFLRLLHTIQARGEGAYQIVIDGPYSLFDSVTKYGLQLALALPAIRECDAWSLDAELCWGPERLPLRFRLAGARDAGETQEDLRLPDDVDRLLRGLAALGGPWRAAPASCLLDLPGVGVCVPDLVLEHEANGQRVYVEVLGYWSRDAVWRRVELVEKGLGAPVVFAVGQHLRVSEAALGEDEPAALYVYKRTILPKALLERVNAVAAR